MRYIYKATGTIVESSVKLDPILFQPVEETKPAGKKRPTKKV